MVRPERFELPTYSSGGCRSIQLSYGRVVPVYIEPRVPSTQLADNPGEECRLQIDDCLTTINFPEALPVVIHAQDAVLGIVTLSTSGTWKEAADMGALPVEIFGNREGRAATARDQKHAGERFLIFSRLSDLLHKIFSDQPSVTIAIGPRFRLLACRTFFRSRSALGVISTNSSSAMHSI